MTDKERIEQIEQFIKLHGYTMLHAADVAFLIKMAKRGD